MSDLYELNAESRLTSGKAESRRIRRLENKVPAIVYGGEKDPSMITLDQNKLGHALENEGFYSHILTLNIAGQKEKVVLKALHRHPSRPKIMHADFLRVSAKTKITMQVPLHFIGADVAPGVKDHDGVVAHVKSEVEIRCLPDNLPEFIEVDLSQLNLGESIHLSELKLPKGVEIPALIHGKEADQPVANIHKPVVVVEEVAAPEEEEAPEVITAKTEGGSEAEASSESEPEA